MNGTAPLDLGVLARFKASDLLGEPAPAPATGVPMQVPLPLIDFDPAQPRQTVEEATLAELAESVRVHGVLEPVSLRRSAADPGRYIVNRGERRVRAARRAGLDAVPAFLDERVDPYAQAAENLHRESMSPFDLARFIAEREKEGQTRKEIARRLGKPRSFVSEAAALIDAPPLLRSAFDAGRVGADLRVLYQLSLAARQRPGETAALLEGEAPITRSSVEAALATAEPGAAPPERQPPNSGGRTVLVVEHRGRRGSLRLKAHDNDKAEIRFGDGSCAVVPLDELRLVCWAAEESSRRAAAGREPRGRAPMR